MDHSIKTVIFDFDGVIVDSVEIKTVAFQRIFSDYGIEIVKKITEHHNEHGGISRYEKIRYYYNKFLGKDISNKELDRKADEFSKLVKNKVTEASYIKGALEFISQFHSVYDFFICTGTPQSEIEEILQRKKINHFFKKIFGSPKTKEKIINEILSRYTKDDVVFIGDAITDYNAAIYNEIKFIGIENKNTKFKKNTIVLQDLTDLKTILDKL